MGAVVTGQEYDHTEEQRWVEEYSQHEKGKTMKWSESGGGGDYQQPPAGVHVARCVKIIDIGTQVGEYQGKTTSRRQVIIGWELPNEKMDDGQPFVVSKFYTASLGEKANLRKDLENWRGRAFTPEELGGFESKNILGKSCMLSLTPNDKGKIRVTGVMALPKGTVVPDQINTTFYFSLEEFDAQQFDQLSDGIKKMVEASPEYQRAKNGQLTHRVLRYDL